MTHSPRPKFLRSGRVRFDLWINRLCPPPSHPLTTSTRTHTHMRTWYFTYWPCLIHLSIFRIMAAISAISDNHLADSPLNSSLSLPSSTSSSSSTASTGVGGGEFDSCEGYLVVTFSKSAKPQSTSNSLRWVSLFCVVYSYSNLSFFIDLYEAGSIINLQFCAPQHSACVCILTHWDWFV